MKNKRVVLLIMAVILLFSLLPVMPANAKVKLNTTSKELEVGKTATIKISGAKSVKWSVSNNCIKITKKTKKYAKIKAITEGVSYLSAKVKKKTYTCIIYVKPKTSVSEPDSTSFNSIEAENNVKREVKIINNKIIVFLENNYSMPISVQSDCYFYDREENIVDTGYSYLFQLEPGMRGALIFNETEEEYSSYELKYDFFQSFAYINNKSIINSIEIKHNELKDDGKVTGIALTIMNQSSYNCSCCTFLVIFYDNLGNIVDVNTEAEYDIKSKEKEVAEIMLPYNRKTYEDIQYSNYEILLSTAYY